MELSEVIRKRRSIRKFKNDSVPREMISEIIKSARKLRESAFRFLETTSLAIVIAVENVGTWESDGAIVSTFIRLTCVDLDLGSCWSRIVGIVENEARKLLNIPERHRVLYSVL